MKESRKIDVKEVLREFKKKLGEIYGLKLKSLILYGSHARGEATKDSDVDVAVVLDGQISPGHEVDRMIDAITDINLEYGVLLSVYPVAQSDYLSVNSPLLLNVRRDGIAA